MYIATTTWLIANLLAPGFEFDIVCAIWLALWLIVEEEAFAWTPCPLICFAGINIIPVNNIMDNAIMPSFDPELVYTFHVAKPCLKTFFEIRYFNNKLTNGVESCKVLVQIKNLISYLHVTKISISTDQKINSFKILNRCSLLSSNDHV